VDILVENRNATYMTFMKNINGLFPNPVKFNISGEAGAVIVCDVNGDGKPDAVLSCPNSNRVVVMLNTSQ
jgi:hypothetical protein